MGAVIRQDDKQRCCFQGKCDGPDIDCQFNRNIGSGWFCVHRKNSPDCTQIRDGTFPRGLTEEADRDLSLLGCNTAGCYKRQDKTTNNDAGFMENATAPISTAALTPMSTASSIETSKEGGVACVTMHVTAQRLE